MASKLTLDVANPLEVLRRFSAFYPCGQDQLVAYQETYIDESGQTKNFVGDTYFNLAYIEPHQKLREYFVKLMAFDIQKRSFDSFDKIVGIGISGLTFLTELGHVLETPAVFLASTKTEDHDIFPGEKILLMEDVCSNFGPIPKNIEFINSLDSKVVGIVSIVNRSDSQEWFGLPIFSAAFKHSPQFKQDDPQVRDLVAAGKIIWEAKNFWQQLENSKH